MNTCKVVPCITISKQTTKISRSPQQLLTAPRLRTYLGILHRIYSGRCTLVRSGYRALIGWATLGYILFCSLTAFLPTLTTQRSFHVQSTRRTRVPRLIRSSSPGIYERIGRQESARKLFPPRKGIAGILLQQNRNFTALYPASAHRVSRGLCENFSEV
ncbi:hypothetical protein F5Y10DRAFT_22320 [Nemania abortiva]|nr:hypothetical protein F5Y10DRAFT_22320 [Nemania abortiva]